LSIVKNVKWLFIDIYKYSQFDGIIAAGERVYSDFKGLFYRSLVPSSKVKYLPNGIPTAIFFPCIDSRMEIRSKHLVNSKTLFFVLASRLHAQKGIKEAVDGLLSIGEIHPFKAVVIGDGPEELAIKAYVKSVGIADKVDFVKSVSLSILAKYLNAADVYIFPTLHEEGLPLLPLEALATGAPVLASGHLKEILSVSDSVYPIDPRDPNSYVLGINKCLNKFQIQATRSSLLPEKYSMASAAKEYCEYFKSLRK